MTNSEDNRNVEALYRHANTLKDTRAEEAIRLYVQALEIDPEHVPSLHNFAVLLEQKGRFDEAIRHYQAVHRLKPTHVKSLARLIAISPADTLVADAERLLATGRLPDDDRIRLEQGLGKYFDRQQRFDEAFEHFSAAKAAVKRHTGAFEEKPLGRYFDRIIETFSADYFAALHGRGGSDSARPVFIVGMPRSGTSLTEQILAKHPAILAAGELKGIPDLVKSLQPQFPQCMRQMDSQHLRDLGERYLASIDTIAKPAVVRVTDKLPVNFMHLGLIAALFPNARVIHCRRDPLDIALSCFVELFKLKHDFTTDLESIGRYYLQYERLMAHWRKVLPLPLYEQRYEALVADPVAGSRMLVAHCALPWHEACVNFQGADRTVTTPSRWQVRQPIYPTSVGRWRNYERHLAPLQQLLAKHGFAQQRSEHSYTTDGA